MSLRFLLLITLGGLMNSALAVSPTPVGPITVGGNCQNQGTKVELTVNEQKRTFDVSVRDFGNQTIKNQKHRSALERQVCSVVIPMATNSGENKGISVSAEIKWRVSLQNSERNRISFYREYFWAGETASKLTSEWSQSGHEELTDRVKLKSRDPKRMSENLRLQFSYVIRKSDPNHKTVVNFSGQSQWRY